MSTDADWQALYDLIPKIDCKRKCQQYCGPVGMTIAEYERLPIKPEIILRVGEDVYIRPAPGAKCALLKGNTCKAYEHRPLICRLWGVSVDLPCPHGCKAERLLSPDETRCILLQGELLSKGGDG